MGAGLTLAPYFLLAERYETITGEAYSWTSIIKMG